MNGFPQETVAMIVDAYELMSNGGDGWELHLDFRTHRDTTFIFDTATSEYTRVDTVPERIGRCVRVRRETPADHWHILEFVPCEKEQKCVSTQD